MTKKDFNELLKKDYGTLKINEICYINRWKTDALGQDVDKLQIVFNNPCGAYGDHSEYIKARDFQEAKKEISKIMDFYIKFYFADFVVKRFLNGR